MPLPQLSMYSRLDSFLVIHQFRHNKIISFVHLLLVTAFCRSHPQINLMPSSIHTIWIVSFWIKMHPKRYSLLTVKR